MRRPRTRLWLSVHSWVGLKLYLVLSVILVSGTLAVVAHEIDWIVQPEMRADPSRTHASIGEIVAPYMELERAGRDVALLDGFISIPLPSSRTAANAVVVSRERGVGRLWVDPVTARVRGETPLLSPGFFVAQLHQSLFVPVLGTALVSLFALFVATSLVTGTIAYKRWWRGFRRLPRKRSPRLFAGELHRLLGVWSLGFLAIIAVTSLVYLWDFVLHEQLGFPSRVSEHEHEHVSDESLARLGPEAPARLPIDALVAAALARHPNFQITGLVLPSRAEDPLSIFGTSGEVLTLPTGSRIDVDPWTGEILGQDLAAEHGAWARANDAVHPLHFGTFAGGWSKLAWFVFGCALSALAITGVMVNLRRLALREKHGATLPERRGPMGRWKLVNVAILVAALGATYLFAAFVADPFGRSAVAFADTPVGPWHASLEALDELAVLGRADPIRAGGRPQVVVTLCPGCGREVKDARLQARGLAAGEGEPLAGRGDVLQGFVSLPDPIAGSELVLTLTGWDGREHEARWPLDPAAKEASLDEPT